MSRLALYLRRFRHSLRPFGAAFFITALFVTTLELGASPHIAAPSPADRPDETLRQAGEGRHILVGTAAASPYLAESDYVKILGSEFSQLQAENEMKFAIIHPRPDTDSQPYDFHGGDALVAFAQAHNMAVRGHTLVWHRQVPEWITKGNIHRPRLRRFCMTTSIP